MKFKVYLKGSGDTADFRIGFTPAPKGKPLQVPSSEIWYVRPIGPLGGAQLHQLADILVESNVPGIDFSNRWDITDETLAILSRCSQLRFLNISRTKVTDTGLEALAELLRLEILRASENATNKGLAALGGLGRLEDLDLDGAKVTDAGMAAVSKLRRLKSLTLSNTRVGDKGLTALRPLNRLETLVLSAGITDASVPVLADLSSLRSLDGSATRISDFGWGRIAGLRDLRALYLNPQSTDAAIIAVGKCKSLRILDLTGTKMTDVALSRLANLSNLQELALTRTSVTDAGLSRLEGLRSLRVLELSDTQVTPAGLLNIAKNHPKLETLAVSWTHLGNDGLEGLALMKNLKTVILNGSPMPQSVTRHLRAMARLQRDRLSENSTAYSRALGDKNSSATFASRQKAEPRKTYRDSSRVLMPESLSSRTPAGISGGGLPVEPRPNPEMEKLYAETNPTAAYTPSSLQAQASSSRYSSASLPGGLRRLRQIEGENGGLGDIQGAASGPITEENYTAENSLGEITINSEAVTLPKSTKSKAKRK